MAYVWIAFFLFIMQNSYLLYHGFLRVNKISDAIFNISNINKIWHINFLNVTEHVSHISCAVLVLCYIRYFIDI